MQQLQKIEQEKGYEEISRRGFLKVAGTVVIYIGVGGCPTFDKSSGKFIRSEDLEPNVVASKGYLLVDTKKCQGCVSCMLSCSLVHEGVENLSFSRIQVMQNPFEKYPEDITVGQCRQCISPACVEACPTGALHISKKHGNIRMIDASKCSGCRSCIAACPYEPVRLSFDYEKEHALKCDMCMNAPFWKEQGGVKGKQACVSVCPMGAIMFTGQIPIQKGNMGYEVNLRGKAWEKMGFPTD